ncbi:MAG: response regulator transcription factor [Candidatus Acidiferrales bacterium]
MSVKILLADDYVKARQATRLLLAEHSEWEVCGDAEDGLDAVVKAATLKPDLVILDLSMPKMNGLEAAKIIHAADPELPLLAFSVDGGDLRMLPGIRAAGFRGAVSKSTGWLLPDAIELLLEGKAFFGVNSSAPAAPAIEPSVKVTPEPTRHPADEPQDAKKAAARSDDPPEPPLS